MIAYLWLETWWGNRMLREKIGQMLVIGFQGKTLNADDVILQAIRAKQIGGVILFASNVESPTQLAQLTALLHAEAKRAELETFVIAMDYEGGTVDRLSVEMGFPKTYSAEALGQMSDDEIMQHASQMAKTLKAAGIDLNFAPTVDVNINPDNPIIGKRERSFSSNAKRVTECAAIFTRAHEEQGILCAYKHFPGHGSSIGDTHLDFVDVTSTWQKEELLPYIDLTKQFGSRELVMASHVVHSGLDPKGYPASLSRAMVQNILREQCHFEGVVVSDDMQMKAVADHYSLSDILTLAINAGVDMLIFGNQLSVQPQDPVELIERIMKLIQEGRIPRTQIDIAHARLMRMRQGADILIK